MSLRHGLSVLGRPASHGLARQAVVIGELDHRVGQQCQRPASSVQRLRPAGGLAHLAATSRASSLPVSLCSAPGRGSSLKARPRMPSTKRRLARSTVERLTLTVRRCGYCHTYAMKQARFESSSSVGGWLQSEAMGLWPALLGSLSFRRSPCVRENCPACMSGEQHSSYVLYGRVKGRRVASTRNPRSGRRFLIEPAYRTANASALT